MAFQLEDLIIDRIVMGVAESSSGELLYTLTQLSDATIEVTSESKEARDKDGTLIKKFYTGKSGTFTATNAMINVNILAEGSGSAKQVASVSSAINMPFVREVEKGTATVTISGLVSEGVSVIGVNASGAKIATYSKNTAASATNFVVADDTITLPNDSTIAKFEIVGERSVVSGVKIVNRADEFPGTVSLTLKALAIEPCTPDVVRAIYIKIPSFQVSPDVSIGLTTDATLNYNGDMQVAYCNESGKVLYEIYVPEDDE